MYLNLLFFYVFAEPSTKAVGEGKVHSVQKLFQWKWDQISSLLKSLNCFFQRSWFGWDNGNFKWPFEKSSEETKSRDLKSLTF